MKRKSKKLKTKLVGNKRLATLWGELTLSALDSGKWFGPNGQAPSLCDIPVSQIVKSARLAGRFALKHRARYPLRSQDNA